MRAGSLRRRVTLQSRATAHDAYGQQSTSWATVATTWADIQPLSGRELLSAQAQQAETTHKVLIRYRAGVTSAMRLLYQGRVFNIQSVTDPDMAHVTLELLCSEGLNQG